MNESSLTKLVDVQGLSLALAKTKADYDGQISGLSNQIPEPDWEEDNYNKNYIANKPPIRAGVGQGSVVEGLQESGAGIYTLYLTGESNATTFSYTTTDNIEDVVSLDEYRAFIVFDAIRATDNSKKSTQIKQVLAIDFENNIITFDSKVSSIYASLSSTKALLYYKYKESFGAQSHAEGRNTVAKTAYAHAEGNSTLSNGLAAHAEGTGTIATGMGAHAEGSYTSAIENGTHSEGERTVASGNYAAHAEGYYSIASGNYAAHAEGYYSIASGNYAAHAEGTNTIASGDCGAHAEGDSTRASGSSSHAEGSFATYTVSLSGEAGATTYTINSGAFQLNNRIAYLRTGYNRYYFYEADIRVLAIDEVNSTITLDSTISENDAISNTSYTIWVLSAATGLASHSEGIGTLASGGQSHAEGNSCIASGQCSHAEGSANIASAQASHAEGRRTIAASQFQHAEGKWNVQDSANTYAHIVGNGTADDARSNAYTLDWNGNGVYAGKITVGTAPTNNMDVATKQYVDSNKGSSLYVVNITQDAQENYSADKTYSEIMTHYNAGDIVVARYSIYTYSLSDAYEGVHFINSNENGVTMFSISTENDVDFQAHYNSLTNLYDTNVQNPSNGQVLTYSSGDWVNATAPNTTYSLSMSGNVITLTGSDSSTSSVTLPVYNGSVTTS